MSHQAEVEAAERPSEKDYLFSAVQRLLLMPKSHVAVWLRLSTLPVGVPKPHQRRVAQAIMETAAHHHEGDVFSLSNGDLVLLCRAPTHDGVEPAAHPTALPHTFCRLLHTNCPSAAELTQIRWLEHDGVALLAQIAETPA